MGHLKNLIMQVKGASEAPNEMTSEEFDAFTISISLGELFALVKRVYKLGKLAAHDDDEEF